MLVAKFIVPKVRNIHNDIIKLSSRDSQCSKQTVCKNLQKVKKKRQVALYAECQDLKCAETHNEQICGKKLLSEPESKCQVKTPADNYEEAYQGTTNQATIILKNVQDESKSLLDQLRQAIELSKNNEQTKLQEYLYDIKKKLQKLLLLDPSFGSLKRKSAMALNYQIRQAFSEVECDVLPQVKRIQEITDNLERDTLICINRAKSLILACRKCTNPLTLNKCIAENANYAEKILEKTAHNAKVNLGKIEVLQREILGYHKATVGDISETYHNKSKALLKHLDDCIYAARTGKKR